ncbi:MAG: ATP-binding protein [Rhodoferax sp.]|nr:ATP-binding protein [Rhodoferax sp.]
MKQTPPASRPAAVNASRLQHRLGGPRRQRGALTSPAPANRQAHDLRHYQAELEIQNKALRFSQSAAESAYERFVTLFSNLPLALMVVLEGGQILQTNAQALALLQPLESDPPPTYLLPLFNASDLQRVKQGFVQAHQQGVAMLTELTIHSGVDGRVEGDLHIAHIDDAQDGAAQFICAIIDQGPQIAQRLALEQAAHTLRQSNLELMGSRGRLAAIIDSSLDAIVGVDAAQRITVFNPAATRLFGCSTEQAQGQLVTRFLPALELTLGTLGESVSMQLGELNGLQQDGQKVVLDVSLSRERHANGDIMTLFIHDLTARKKMQAHRDALEAQLRESQKMQAIGTMAGGIAHDFNNIIGAILGNVELAREDAPADTAVATSLAEIDKAGRRARDLVRQILTFSRNDPPMRTPLCLAEVVQETTRLLKVTLPPQVNIALDIAPHTPAVLADATQIEQVLLNLCTNAIHAIGDTPGTIRIELGYALRSADDDAERHGGLPGQHVWLCVSDTGCGIDPEIQQRVFEPFFTTKPVGQGTGLGLSVVHGIMRSHHGNVQLQSVPGVGSTFTLLFPVPDTPTAPSGEATPPVAASAKPVMPGLGQRVMYVDDDQALVFLVKRLLTRKGYTVVTFTDPKQALLTLADPSTRCDLLVTDFNMPGYSGVDLMRDVARLRPALWVALASGYVTPEIERQALAAGARALIHKPNDVNELCATVQRLLQESQAGPGSL